MRPVLCSSVLLAVGRLATASLCHSGMHNALAAGTQGVLSGQFMMCDIMSINFVCRGMPKVLAAEVVKLQTKPYKGLGGGSEIVAAFLAYKKARPTLLFSHGNAVDLGIMLPFLK